MDSLFLLIPVSLILLAIAIWGFFWAVNHDQFDDMDSPATRILFDDDEQATLDELKAQREAHQIKKAAKKKAK